MATRKKSTAAKAKTTAKSKAEIYQMTRTAKALDFLSEAKAAKAKEPYTHIYHHGAVCETDKRGHATPDNLSPNEIVLDATEGFIPLWAENVTLRWRFRESSMLIFADPDAAKGYVRELLARAIRLWGDFVPVRFHEAHDAWDFEINVAPDPKCSPLGCVLASAFFPDGGQHDITLYPTMFQQSVQEQIETLAHEIGHVFGLRHFFAEVSETDFPVEVFGKHDRESIMNYGPDSVMSDADRKDLKTLYEGAWGGVIDNVNGTPIRLVLPFSAMRPQAAASVAVQMPPLNPALTLARN